MKDAIVPAQSRAGRALLDWSRDKLATESGVPARTVADFELANTSPRLTTVAAIRAALETAGVQFLEENGGGPGVRLAKLTSLPEPDTSRPTDPRYPGMRSIGPESEVRGGPEAPEQAEVQTDD